MADASAVPPRRFGSLSGLPERGWVSCAGYIESITIQPATAAPRFTAIVADWDRAEAPADEEDSGRRLELIWIGQRQVPGITAGIRLGFEGMVTRVKSVPTIYNPRYEILAREQPGPGHRRHG